MADVISTAGAGIRIKPTITFTHSAQRSHRAQPQHSHQSPATPDALMGRPRRFVIYFRSTQRVNQRKQKRRAKAHTRHFV